MRFFLFFVIINLMDDNKINPKENQPKPIFETIPEDQLNENQSGDNLKPEEVAPEVVSPEEVSSTPPPEIPEEGPPLVYEENKNKYLIIAAGVIFFSLIIFFLMKGLFGGVNRTKKEVKLIYWGLWEEKEVFEPLINQYRAKNKHLTIEYQKMAVNDYREKLIARSEKGQGPDIFRFHNTWLPEIKNIVAPLPAIIMSNSEFEKTFYSVHQRDLKVGENYYGLPLTIDGLVLIYNDSLFKKAGIDRPPSNWDEVIDYVGQLSVKDRGGQLITSGIAIGTASNVEHFSDIFGLMLAQNGGDLKKIDEPEAVQALEAYRKFAEPPTSFWDETMPNSIAAFIQEKVAMILAPSWEVLVIKAANPDIKIKVAPVPRVPGAKPISLASYWVEGVSRYSKNQIEAWKFLRFLIDKENLTKLYEIESKLRLFGEPYSRRDLGSIISQNEYIGPVIQQAEFFISMPVASRTYDNGLNDEIIRYLENAINATIQGTTYSEALKTAKQGIDQVFSRF